MDWGKAFDKASQDSSIRAILPESNKTTGNIGIEYLVFKHRLNIYAEHFYQINHNLLGVPGAKIADIKDVFEEAQEEKPKDTFFTKFGCCG